MVKIESLVNLEALVYYMSDLTHADQVKSTIKEMQPVRLSPWNHVEQKHQSLER